jgi:hypothetical protein
MINNASDVYKGGYMNQLPEWLQFIITFSLYELITVVSGLVVRRKYLSSILRTILLITSIGLIVKTYQVLPVSNNVKDYAVYLYGLTIIIYLVLAYKNKWLWDNAEDN